VNGCSMGPDDTLLRNVLLPIPFSLSLWANGLASIHSCTYMPWRRQKSSIASSASSYERTPSNRSRKCLGKGDARAVETVVRILRILLAFFSATVGCGKAVLSAGCYCSVGEGSLSWRWGVAHTFGTPASVKNTTSGEHSRGPKR
jgi:hypothetical protein